MKPAPIVHQVVVEHPTRDAFETFTEQVGGWWSIGDKNVLGPGSSVGFEDLALVERNQDSIAVWAEIVEWEPPGSVRLAFHPGAPPEDATDLRIVFTPVADGTQVTLEHIGWERMAGGEAARPQIEQGWAEVLDSYRAYLGS
jgi:uncharacterized protein YndB with AHSA1/START domain